MTGAECLVKRLISHGSDKVFGYPGAAVMSLYEALRRHKSEITHIRTSHEQGAAHAADGYARVSGKPGICISTSGPGATNLVTGIANAFMDSVPVIFITGNVERNLIGTDSFQEVDIVGITVPITKYSFTIRSEEELIPAVDRAFEICMSGRKGPVLIDIPKDILEGQCVYTEFLINYKTDETKSESDISDIVKCLVNASKPLVIIGGGVKSSGSAESVIALCNKLRMPVCSSLMASDAIPRGYRYNLGIVGQYATDTLRKAICDSDCIIACGTRLSNRIFKGLDEKEISKKTLIHIDSDRAEINKILKCDYFVCDDCRIVIDKLLDEVPEIPKREWADVTAERQANELESISGFRSDLKHLFNSVDRAFSSECTVVTDVGSHQMLTASLYPFSGTSALVTSGGLGTMGFGLGASIGAYFAAPDKNTVLFTGDGSFGMNLNELYTLSSNHIKMLIVVINNRKLGMVYDLQKDRYGKISETRHSKNFLPAKIAKSFGLNGVCVRNLSEFEKALRTYINSEKTMVIDYITEGD